MSKKHYSNRNGAPVRVKTFNGTAIIVAVVTAILALAIVLIGVGSSWFTNPVIGTWFGAEGGREEAEQPDDGNNVLVTPEVENAEIQMVTRAIPRAMFASYSIDERATSAKELTVTFTPADTTNQKVTMTANWKNANSTWAKGKSVATYFKLTQDANQGPHATLQCLKDFGEPIEITVTSVMKPSLTATSRVDYVARILDFGGVTINSTSDSASIADMTKATIDCAYTVLPDKVEGECSFVMESSLADLCADFDDMFGGGWNTPFNVTGKIDCYNVFEMTATNGGTYVLKGVSDALYRRANGNITNNTTAKYNIGELEYGTISFYYNNELIYTYKPDNINVNWTGSFIMSNIKAPSGITNSKTQFAF